MKKIISFDVWDTIIKRKCHPEEIKLYTARYIVLKYANNLKEEYKNIYEILNLRNKIEEDLCKENKEKGFDGECRILDVFNKLQEEIFINKGQNISEELLRVEIDREKEMIYVNPCILEIFEKYKDLKMYCISDFYMSAENLKELLDYLNLNIKFEKIYSSADYLLNKREGNLYKKAEEELDIKPEEHIHVGDNIYSDIQKAKELGIETIKIEKESMEFKPEEARKFDFEFSKYKKEEKNLEDKLYNIGIKLSPLLYFFGYNIVEYAIKNKIPKVYYSTREGETFIKIHELIKENNVFGVELPDCEILEVSRMATFSASLKEFSIAELLRLWSQYRVQSVKALFKTLAIDVEKYNSYMEKYDINISEDIWEPWFNIKIQNLCHDKEFLEKINEDIKIKREELLKYFEKKKGIVNDEEQLFMVDIGWRGTIQDNIAYIFNNKKVGGYYITLYDYYNYQPENTYKLMFIKDNNIKWNEVAKMITLLEWIFNPSSGSVIEYKNGEAIRKAKKEESDAIKNTVRYIQEGMLEGAKIINNYLKVHPYEAREFEKYIYELLKDLNRNPDKELVDVYYGIVFNDTFGTGAYVKKDNKLTFLQKLNILKCRDMLRKEDWKEAFIVYNDMRYMNYFLNMKSTIKKIIGRK